MVWNKIDNVSSYCDVLTGYMQSKHKAQPLELHLHELVQLMSNDKMTQKSFSNS